MQKIFTIIIASLFIPQAMASSVTCSLTNILNGEATSAQLSLPASEDGVYSDGVDVGQLNYSFWFSGDEDGIGVFFFENNRSEDEVGNLWCDLAPAGEVFCLETLENELGPFGEFSCVFENSAAN